MDDGTLLHCVSIASPGKKWVVKVNAANEKLFLNHIKSAIQQQIGNKKDIYDTRDVTYQTPTGTYYGEIKFGHVRLPRNII